MEVNKIEEVPPSGPDGHCLRRNCTGQHVLAIDGFHTLSFEDRLAVVSSPLEFMSGKGEPDGLNEERLELTAESPSVSCCWPRFPPQLSWIRQHWMGKRSWTEEAVWSCWARRAPA